MIFVVLFVLLVIGAPLLKLIVDLLVILVEVVFVPLIQIAMLIPRLIFSLLTKEK